MSLLLNQLEKQYTNALRSLGRSNQQSGICFSEFQQTSTSHYNTLYPSITLAGT
ncbi:unnamed protein product [Ceratitis capitata]|uniref:(Mediterranean fruit fly) hypothetical protein n=1 Tax=Ceratitis capitata TaxID=7213 RepID=A0A811UNJ0_CERCA|nr:unnamed protein product [Ceratitis capitata]